MLLDCDDGFAAACAVHVTVTEPVAVVGAEIVAALSVPTNAVELPLPVVVKYADPETAPQSAATTATASAARRAERWRGGFIDGRVSGRWRSGRGRSSRSRPSLS
jgi:hypothetical protein